MARDVSSATIELTGAEWIVKMHPSRMMSWKSRSTVEEIDRDAHRFTYRTVNADGNPSYTEWKWEITPLESGADVSVTWDVHLETIDRRLLAGPIRQRQLRKEVAASLHAIDGATRQLIEHPPRTDHHGPEAGRYDSADEMNPSTGRSRPKRRSISPRDVESPGCGFDGVRLRSRAETTTCCGCTTRAAAVVASVDRLVD